MSLPLETVTLLLTDVEGGGGLWENHPEVMGKALAQRDALASEIVARHEGVLIQNQDRNSSLLLVFTRAADAIPAACALQQAFLSESWPVETPLRFRMALHTGAMARQEGRYYGTTLNRCAHLLAVGHGGQILLSTATRQQAHDLQLEGIMLQDLGTHRLKDLMRPEQIFQLLHPNLPADFPPLRSLNALPHNNLPQLVSSFIGREKEIQEIKRLLAQTRLVTLTGVGGAGKTRLALQVGAELLTQEGDGVWLVELAPLADPELVPQTVASVLGVREEPERPIQETLVTTLRNRGPLLILDSCEHVLQACAQLAETLLRACPDVRLLVTSREGLNITWETLYRVPALSLPDLKRLPPPERLPQYESVRLFVERAQAVHPGFTVNQQNAPATAQLCVRLDGIPLALELAAARVPTLSVEQIAARLDDRFRLLTGGSRTSVPRQQTLRALMDWSYQLLSEPEKALLRRLTVFAGGWTLEAAEALCRCAGDESAEAKPALAFSFYLSPFEVLDLLRTLVEKSLVVYEPGTDGAGRYYLLENIREYGKEKRTPEETEEAYARHKDYFLSFLEHHGKQPGLEQSKWQARLDAEHDNLRVALETCLKDPAAVRDGLRLARQMVRFWDMRGDVSEGRRYMTLLLARPEVTLYTEELAYALNGAGNLARSQGDSDAARDCYERSLALKRTLNNPHTVAITLSNLGALALERKDFVEAFRLLKESRALYEQIGNKIGATTVRVWLALLKKSEGDLDAARQQFEETLSLTREQGDEEMYTYVLGNLADIACLRGDAIAARQHLSACLSIRRRLNDRRGLAYVLETFGGILVVEGRPLEAARLWGAAEAFRESAGMARITSDDFLDICLTRARAAAPPKAFAHAWMVGRSLSLEDAVLLVLAEVTDSSLPPA